MRNSICSDLAVAPDVVDDWENVFLWNEANRSILRSSPVSFNPKNRFPPKPKVFVAGLLFIGFLLGFPFGVIEEWRDLYVRAFGIMSQAKVADRHEEGGEGTTYYVTYRFVANDQAEYSNTGQVSEAIYRQTALDSLITIQYAPYAPQFSHVPYARVWIPFSTIIVLFVWIILIWSYQRESRRLSRLRAHGHVVRGRLVAWDAKQTGDYEEDSVVSLEFVFCNPEGHPVSGSVRRSVTVKSHPQLNPPPKNSLVAILYVNDRLYDLL
jgi:hypothetical protein